MDIHAIILAAVVVGVVGIVIGLILGAAGKKFHVDIDPNEEAINDILPGNNCGACGFPGCSGLAAAIAQGNAEVNACPVGGPDIAAAIGEVMGVAAGESVRNVAFVMCGGDCEKATDAYIYTGVTDCNMVKNMPNGGPKACTYGCLGLGSCVKACPFDAIHIENGIAVVDKEECKACEKCVKACPNGIIEMIPYAASHQVNCHSNDKGKGLMAACKVGCIGCKKCEKACNYDAIKVDNFLAHIDYSKCVGCGSCVNACPRDIINGRPAPEPEPEPVKEEAKEAETV